MVKNEITENAINFMLRELNPIDVVVQVLTVKQIKDKDRYRSHLSDSQWSWPTCLLGTQMNDLIESNQLRQYSLIKIKRHIINYAKDKPVIVMSEIEVVGNPDCQLGSPVEWTRDISPPVAHLPPGIEDGNARMSNGGGPSASSGHPRPLAPANVKPEPMEHNQMALNGPTGRRAPFGAGQQRGGGRGGAGRTGASATVFPITGLTPYQNNWTIRARVVSKVLKHYKNTRKEGDILSMDLMDESGAIRSTSWDETAIRFNNHFHENSVYYISRGTLKPANRNFSSIANDYELTLNADSMVELCEDDSSYKVPSMKFNFVKIGQIPTMTVGTLVDVIAVVRSVAQMGSVVSKKTQEELKKREVVLVDDSNSSINLTLWNKEAEDFSDAEGHIIALRGVRIQEFMSALSLSSLQQSLLQMDPDIPEAHQLRTWYDSEGADAQMTSISNKTGEGPSSSAAPILLAYAVADKLGASDKPDYYEAKAVVMQIKKDTALYKACSQPECNKKVTELETGYRCQKCMKDDDAFKWRLMLKVLICDFTGEQWITCFQEQGEKLLGITSDALGALRDENPEAADAVFQKAQFKEHLFRLRSKVEVYNDESRINTMCAGIKELNYASYEEHLLREIAVAESL